MFGSRLKVQNGKQPRISNISNGIETLLSAHRGHCSARSVEQNFNRQNIHFYKKIVRQGGTLWVNLYIKKNIFKSENLYMYFSFHRLNSYFF